MWFTLTAAKQKHGTNDQAMSQPISATLSLSKIHFVDLLSIFHSSIDGFFFYVSKFLFKYQISSTNEWILFSDHHEKNLHENNNIITIEHAKQQNQINVCLSIYVETTDLPDGKMYTELYGNGLPCWKWFLYAVYIVYFSSERHCSALLYYNVSCIPKQRRRKTGLWNACSATSTANVFNVMNRCDG